MNLTAQIRGIRYSLLETLNGVDSQSLIVVCQNDAGERFACTEDVWRASAEVVPFSDAKVNSRSSADDKIKLFRSLFRGREDVYAKRWQNLKSGNSG